MVFPVATPSRIASNLQPITYETVRETGMTDITGRMAVANQQSRRRKWGRQSNRRRVGYGAVPDSGHRTQWRSRYPCRTGALQAAMTAKQFQARQLSDGALRRLLTNLPMVRCQECTNHQIQGSSLFSDPLQNKEAPVHRQQQSPSTNATSSARAPHLDFHLLTRLIISSQTALLPHARDQLPPFDQRALASTSRVPERPYLHPASI